MKPVLLNSIKDYPKSGLGRITTATNQKVHEVLNGDYTFTFDMLVTDRLFLNIKEESIIATSVSKLDTDFFYVKNIDVKNPGILTVTCNHVTMLTNENYARGKLAIDGKTVKTVLNEMVSMLDLPGQQFNYKTDIDKTIGKTDIVYTNSNPGQILIGETNSLVNVLDARLVRKGTNLTLTSKNTDHYIDFRRGKNIAGVSINRNTNNLTTSIVPYFNMKSKEVSEPDDSVPTNQSGWTIRSVESGIVTVIKSYAATFTDNNTPITNRYLGPNTKWSTDMQRVKNGVYQYRVATNMWVLGADISLTSGSVGDVISKPATTVDPSDTVPENQLQYGPEIYSPLYKKDNFPHRKYIDYSSRVDNIPDLIDVSSNYFIENPDIDKPTYTISINVAQANQKRVVDAQVGDIARIYDPQYNLETNETIIERTFDPDSLSNESLKAGVFQQTIFRYLDKRIQESSKKVDDVKKQTNGDIDTVIAGIDGVQGNLDKTKDDLTNQMDEASKKAQDTINNVKDTVTHNQNSLSNFMNSGGNSKIRWIPSLAEATQMEITTPYGYWLLDDRGAGFHSNNGTVKAGLSADGRVYADSITGNKLTGTTINGGTITGGVINGAQLTGVSIEGAQSIRLNNNGNVTTSIANYGISTPAITVRQIDGANLIQTNQLTVSNIGTIKYLHIASGGNISCDGGGLYVQGPLYVDGRKI